MIRNHISDCAAEFVFCYLALRVAYVGAPERAWRDFRVQACRRRYRQAAGLPPVKAPQYALRLQA